MIYCSAIFVARSYCCFVVNVQHFNTVQRPTLKCSRANKRHECGEEPQSPKVQSPEPAHPRPRRGVCCEPDALQARSRDAAHWVTVQSSRMAAALQTPARATRELCLWSRSSVTARADGCSRRVKGAAHRQPSAPRTHQSLGQETSVRFSESAK